MSQSTASPSLPLNWEVLPPGERVLVAVSGGADSMALLLALQRAGVDLVAGHVNHDLHELRNGECDHDEAWLRERCTVLGVELRVTKVELPRRLKAGEVHINEVVARDARYTALAQLAREAGCTRIATAHTSHDVLETLLLFWMRSATVRGFQGILPARPLGGDLLLVRPLLQATRDQTRAYCLALNQPWREDASNRDPHFLRNRVRHELLPLISDIAGRSVEQLATQTARGCTLAADDETFLEEAAQNALAAITLRGEKTVNPSARLLVLDGSAWGTLPAALQRRTLRRAAYQMGAAPTFEHVEAVRQQVVSGGKRTVWQWPSRRQRGENDTKIWRVNCEWTGVGSGNRLRLRGVPTEDDFS